MVEIMGIVNLSPESFYGPSIATDKPMERISELAEAGATIIDIGAVSTRPGAAPVGAREEWRRLKAVLETAPGKLSSHEFPTAKALRFSVDTTRASIVRRVYRTIGDFTVNDISAGEDDGAMLQTVAELGLGYIAMHKRGNPRSMDSLTSYPDGIMPELLRYFGDFAERAALLGIRDWILDPGLGFAKTPAQCWEILENLEQLQVFGRPILIGAADKRFTREVPPAMAERYAWLGAGKAPKGTAIANRLAADHGAAILRVHDLPLW